MGTIKEDLPVILYGFMVLSIFMGCIELYFS